MAVGIGGAREARRFGFELIVQLLQQTAALLGFLALPAAMVAGASVAEITVRATVAATRHGHPAGPPALAVRHPAGRAAARGGPGWSASGSAGTRSARA